ncbi:MAG TPA: ComEC/Rec2 family competence protein [Gaiellaceae bacterium]|nr:ComEC/Rec2 family competence protein [Gaiellaceae bacterium]
MIRGPYVVAGALCGGLACSLLLRAALLPAVALVVAVLVLRPPLALAALLAVAGWCWGSERLQALDRSVLTPRIGTAERALVETLEPARTTRYAVRARARVLRWGPVLRPGEPVLLELPLGRAPPQGSRLQVLGTLRPPSDGERGWLRLHGVHVVLRAGGARVVGRRGSVADRLHAWLARASVPGLAGERRAVLEGVVLGEDQGLSQELRDRFRASGLYHLLAVSGGNVIVVAGGASLVALALGAGRLLAESAALLAIVAYVLAVGPQPSVIRAGIAGALGCLAWLTGRERDRVHALLVGAVALLGWNPLDLLDPGFQLSFAAVGAIFVLAPRLDARLEGYPLPQRAREATALSCACGVCTAPISWAHFHQIPLLTVPANVAAAPVVAPMLALSLVAALLPPLGPALAQANGLLAAYLAACARFFGGLPGAQVRSAAGAAALGAGVLLAAAYAWRSGERAEAGLPAHGNRPAEDRARGAPAA